MGDAHGGKRELPDPWFLCRVMGELRGSPRVYGSQVAGHGGVLGVARRLGHLGDYGGGGSWGSPHLRSRWGSLG